MPTVPYLANSDIRRVVNSSRTGAGLLDGRGASALRDAVLDGRGITATERKDVQALLDADLFEPAARAAVFQFMGTTPAPVPPVAPAGPSASRLVSAAVRTMDSVYWDTDDQTRGFYAHPKALAAANAAVEAFAAVTPGSAEARKLEKAYLKLCERSLYPAVIDQDPYGSPQAPKHRWGAAAAGWVRSGLAARGRMDAFPTAANKYFVAGR